MKSARIYMNQVADGGSGSSDPFGGLNTYQPGNYDSTLNDFKNDSGSASMGDFKQIEYPDLPADPLPEVGPDGYGPDLGSDNSDSGSDYGSSDDSDNSDNSDSGSDYGSSDDSDNSDNSGSSYTVKAGDTLSSIARHTGTSVDELTRLNGISDPDYIEVGQKIELTGGGTGQTGDSTDYSPHTPADTVTNTSNRPDTNTAGAGSSASSDQGTPDPYATGAVSGGVYTVAKGDTLWGISRRFGTNPDELARINNISDIDYIDDGQKIKLPGSGVTTDTTQKADETSPAATNRPQSSTTTSSSANTDDTVSTSNVAPAPTKTSASSSDQGTPDPYATGAVSGGVYTVAKGDTLWGISRRFGTNPDELARINNISDIDYIDDGQKIKLPGSGVTTDTDSSKSAPTPVSTNKPESSTATQDTPSNSGAVATSQQSESSDAPSNTNKAAGQSSDDTSWMNGTGSQTQAKPEEADSNKNYGAASSDISNSSASNTVDIPTVSDPSNRPS